MTSSKKPLYLPINEASQARWIAFQSIVFITAISAYIYMLLDLDREVPFGGLIVVGVIYAWAATKVVNLVARLFVWLASRAVKPVRNSTEVRLELRNDAIPRLRIRRDGATRFIKDFFISDR